MVVFLPSNTMVTSSTPPLVWIVTEFSDFLDIGSLLLFNNSSILQALMEPINVLRVIHLRDFPMLALT
jgi:dimeric dUTPase (all-alpha-NTP-PPase superfamily)